MTRQIRNKKRYEQPRVSVLGNVKDVTHALFWNGSGDILSGFVEDVTGIDVPDGCGPLEALCTGS